MDAMVCPQADAWNDIGRYDPGWSLESIRILRRQDDRPSCLYFVMSQSYQPTYAVSLKYCNFLSTGATELIFVPMNSTII